MLDDTRLDALVHYVCARCENPNRLGDTELNKVLWHSDVFAYAQDGRSITGEVYVKRQFGPVPKNIIAARTRLEASHAIIQFTALRPADISMFTTTQISLVDSVLEAICCKDTTSGSSTLVHDFVWESAEIGEEIPMAAAAFGGSFGEIDEDEMAWAKKEVDKLEQVRMSV